MTSQPPKGRTTLKIAGALFIASAVIELLSATSNGPLFGAVRPAWFSISYHVAYAAVLGFAGYGLWRLHRSGYTAVIVGAVLYTLDRGLLLLNEQAMHDYISNQLSARGMNLVLTVNEVVAMTQLATALFIVGWWLFVVYMMWRKACFSPTTAEPSEAD